MPEVKFRDTHRKGGGGEGERERWEEREGEGERGEGERVLGLGIAEPLISNFHLHKKGPKTLTKPAEVRVWPGGVCQERQGQSLLQRRSRQSWGGADT